MKTALGPLGVVLATAACMAMAQAGGPAPYAVSGPLPQPRLFAEGVISTQDNETGVTFAPDGKTVYFTVIAPGTIAQQLETICVSHFENGRWTKPEVASFSGRYLDGGAMLSPDGSKLFFVSARPVQGDKPVEQGNNIWVVDKTPQGWGEPRILVGPVNSGGHKRSPSLTSDGTLYFTRLDRTPAGPVAAIYRSRLVNGKYADPEKLEDVPEAGYVSTVFVAPDESYLIFSDSGRPDEIQPPHPGYGRGDLYVRVNDHGTWGPARHLDPPINTSAGEYKPWVSPDGKYLFFTSDRGFASERPAKPLTYMEIMDGLNSTLNGLGNIYQVDFGVLSLKPH